MFFIGHGLIQEKSWKVTTTSPKIIESVVLYIMSNNNHAWWLHVHVPF